MIKTVVKLAVIILLTAINSCYYERETDQLKVCFVRNSVIWTMNIDGSEQRQIASGFFNNAPSWSPDGKKILFHKEKAGNLCDIFVINSDGSGLKQLTHNTGSNSSKFPTWSSDGERIVFRSLIGSAGQIVIAEKDGNIINTYDPFGTIYQYPTLSPDNNFIYFTEDNASHRFFRLDLVTKNYHNYGSAGYTSISFSPDGKTIACEKNDEHNIHIFEFSENTDTNYSLFISGRYPCWTPDGKTIVYVSTSGDIYSINIDGTNNKPLTTGGGCSEPCVQGKPK